MIKKISSKKISSKKISSKKISSKKISSKKIFDTSTLSMDDTSMKNKMEKCCSGICEIELITDNLPGFKCVKKLGEGGFGTTFLMKKGSEKIALKVIDTDDSKKPSTEDKPSIEDINNEINMLEKLSTNCAKKRVLCYRKRFDDGNSSFIVTEFIDGVSLDKYKFKKQRDFYRVFGQLIDAVEYIHSENIVHFDIKPQNIMVNKNGDLKIIDFGGSTSGENGIVKRDKYTYTPYYALFVPRKNVKIILERGKDYDWYSTIVTLIDIISSNKHTPRDLQEFTQTDLPKLKLKYLRQEKDTIQNYINKMKTIINYHIKSNSNSFLIPKFMNNARNLLNKINRK